MARPDDWVDELVRIANGAGDGVFDDDWVHELIDMTRPGMEIEFPPQSFTDRQPPFVYDDFD